MNFGIDTFYGCTLIQWAILYAWDKTAEPTYEGAYIVRKKYILSYGMLPQEENNFGIEPDMDFEKVYKLMELIL